MNKPLDGFDFMGYVQTVCCYLYRLQKHGSIVESCSVLFLAQDLEY